MLRNGIWEAMTVKRFDLELNFGGCYYESDGGCKIQAYNFFHVSRLGCALSSMSLHPGFGDCRLVLSSSTGRRIHQSKKLLMQWAVKCGSYPIISSSQFFPCAVSITSVSLQSSRFLEKNGVVDFIC